MALLIRSSWLPGWMVILELGQASRNLRSHQWDSRIAGWVVLVWLGEIVNDFVQAVASNQSPKMSIRSGWIVAAMVSQMERADLSW